MGKITANALSNKVTDAYSVYLWVNCLVIEEYPKQLAATKFSSLKLKTKVSIISNKIVAGYQLCRLAKG